MNIVEDAKEYWKEEDVDEMRVKYFQRLNLLNSYFEPKRDRQESVWVKRNLAEDHSNQIKFSFEILGEDEENLKKFDEHIKSHYYDKLFATSRQNDNQRKTQSILIFDWDDTLICTSFLSSVGFNEIDEEIYEDLKEVDKTAKGLIKKATELGDLYIITNAVFGWVQFSAKKFLPETFKFIMENKVTIMSARMLFGESYPNNPRVWKNYAYLEIVPNYNVNVSLMIIIKNFSNIICMGDANHDIDAAQFIKDNCFLKTIKFKECPNPLELCKEQKEITERLAIIYESPKNMAYKLERKATK